MVSKANNVNYIHLIKAVIKERLDDYFGERTVLEERTTVNAIQTGIFKNLFKEEEISDHEVLVVLIALVPHLSPTLFDQVISESIPKAGDFPQLGGTRGKQFRGFLPTGQTALFLLAGDDLEKQIEVRELFNGDHFFARKRILWLEEVPEGEPQMSGRIILSPEYVELFMSGKVSSPSFSTKFPAQKIETLQDWNDLILNEQTFAQIKEIETWINYGEVLLEDYNMRKKINPGYRALFHGPPGTGKTMTAKLLGKYTGRDVYRIDLSMVVSKFIGETEKNLSNLFAKAENKNWILFFDEADALFGKRTGVKDAHDKYANQEVSYLLQSVESYNGLVILATNLKSNIDDAFVRRFQSIIHFPLPSAKERFQIWNNAFPEKMLPAEKVPLEKIAQRFELSGGEIMNIVHFACLQTLALQKSEVDEETILAGVEREYEKEGKIMRP